MILDANALFDELNITYNEGSKHSTSGWLQLQCPFCGDDSDHLGYNSTKEYFNCWRCGWHPLVETISEIAGIPKWEASQAVERNRTSRIKTNTYIKKAKPRNLKMPLGVGELKKIHIQYLNKRGYTLQQIEELQSKYNLLGTGPIGEYKLRLVIPIRYYGKTVSYQSRDVTGKATKKYLACNSKEEVRPHKDCLFGADLADRNTVVIVEGILDAIKLGPGAVATFGANTNWAQIKQMSDRWKNRYVFFDKDPAGRIGAEKLCNFLSAMPGTTHNIKLKHKKDPGELTYKEAKRFMKSLIFKGQ